MKIKLFIVQLEAIAGDIDKNILKVKNLLEQTKCSSSDLIILPELWTIGWDCPSFDKSAEELFASKTYNFLKEIALQYNSNVIGGSAVIQKGQEKNRNTSIIFNRNGEMVATYDKYHLFSHRGQSEGSFLEEGDSGVLVNMDIGKIGISICYDIRFPELFRKYAFSGADILVNMAAWPKSFLEEYIVLSRARAIENQCFFISSCLTGKINESFDFTGNSQVCDYKGKVIAKLNDEEKVLMTEIDMEEMHQYRKQIPILKDTKLEYKIMEK